MGAFVVQSLLAFAVLGCSVNALCFFSARAQGNQPETWAPQARSLKCGANEAECTWPPKDYKLHTNMGYYKFHAYGATWEAAKAMCEEEGAHLVIINSEKEAVLLRTLYEANPNSVGTQANKGQMYTWTGAQERGTHGVYYTIFGDPLSDSGFWRWVPGQHDDKGFDDGVVFFSVNGALGDQPSVNKYPFVCEIELAQVEHRREWLRA